VLVHDTVKPMKYNIFSGTQMSKNINHLMHTETVVLSINDTSGLIKTPQNRFYGSLVT